MSAWFSLPQQWLMTTWNKQTSTILAQKSAAVLWHCYCSKDKITRTLKRFICKLLRFLLRSRFCQQNWYYAHHYTSSISRYYYNRDSRGQKGKILRWNKHAGHQADPVSVHCLQTTEKPRDKMRIHLGCSTTHSRVKLVPHFHQIFTSSAASKTKTDNNFFAFSSGHEEELKLSLPTTKAN